MVLAGRAVLGVAMAAALLSACSDDGEDRVYACKMAGVEKAELLDRCRGSDDQRDAVIAAHKAALAEGLDRTEARHTEIANTDRTCGDSRFSGAPDDQIAFCRGLCEFNDRILDLYEETMVTFDASKRLAVIARSEGRAFAREIHDRFGAILGSGAIDGWRGKVLSVVDTADGPRVGIEVCQVERGESPYLLVSEPGLEKTRIGDGALIAALRKIAAGGEVSISGKLISGGGGLACPDPDKCLQKGTLGGFLTVRDGVPATDGTAVATGFRLLFALEGVGP